MLLLQASLKIDVRRSLGYGLLFCFGKCYLFSNHPIFINMSLCVSSVRSCMYARFEAADQRNCNKIFCCIKTLLSFNTEQPLRRTMLSKYDWIGRDNLAKLDVSIPKQKRTPPYLHYTAERRQPAWLSLSLSRHALQIWA